MSKFHKGFFCLFLRTSESLWCWIMHCNILWICRQNHNGELTLWRLQSMVSDTFDFFESHSCFLSDGSRISSTNVSHDEFLSNEVNLCVCFWWLVPCPSLKVIRLGPKRNCCCQNPALETGGSCETGSGQTKNQSRPLDWVFFSGKNTRHVNRYVSELVEFFQRIVCFSVFLAGMLQLITFSYWIADWFSFLWDQVACCLLWS